MIISILLNRVSYFKTFRTYFILIYAGFLTFLAREAILNFAPDDVGLIQSSTELMITASLGIAVLWGHLTTRLYLYPERYNIRELLVFSRMRAHGFYQLYLFLMVLAAWVTLVLVGINPGVMAYYLLAGPFYGAVV